MKTKCPGCGVTIQTTAPNELGYIREDVYNRDNDNFLCERCFKLKNYSVSPKKVLVNNNTLYLNNVKKIIKPNDLIVNIIDIFDLEGSVIPNLQTIFSENDLIIIANKYDLFPRSNRPTKLREYLTEYLNDLGIKPLKVLISSGIDSKTPLKIYDLLQSLNRKRIFMIGVSNVGKSTIINALMKEYNKEAILLTTSNTIGTTVDVNSLSVGKFVLFDTPGLINDRQMTYYLNKKSLNYCIPKKYIKPRIYQLNPSQTIFVSGLFSITYLKGEKAGFIFYVSNALMLYRTKAENEDNFYSHHLDDLLTTPTEEERNNLSSIDNGNTYCTYDYQVTKNEEIAISGVGFIGFSSSVYVRIKTFALIKVSKRKALIANNR